MHEDNITRKIIDAGSQAGVGIIEGSTIVDGLRLYVKCRCNPNSEEVILFLHGLACSTDTFRNVFDENYFPDKSLLLVDLIGFGSSEKPADFSYYMEDQAVLISNLLSELPFSKIHIVVHSMGGAIALLLPDSILSRVKSFANVEGNLISEDCGLLSRGIASGTFQEYERIHYKKHLEEFNDHNQLRFEESTPLAIFRSARSLVEWSDNGKLLEKFINLNCRKSYFYGEENRNMPILRRLEFVDKIMIHNSGHGMTTENPKEFYSRLVDFVK